MAVIKYSIDITSSDVKRFIEELDKEDQIEIILDILGNNPDIEERVFKWMLEGVIVPELIQEMHESTEVPSE